MAEYSFTFETENEEATRAFGGILSETLPEGGVLALVGPLAAGKTFLARAFFEKRGYKNGFSSPSYTIINEYLPTENENLTPAYHMDVYRIEDVSELDYIGFSDCFVSSDSVVVEWADMIKEALPDNAVWVNIELSEAESARRFTVSAEDGSFIALLKEKTDACFGC